MELFCTESDLSAQRCRVHRLSQLFGLLCLLTLLCLVIPCLLVRTANAALMLRLSLISVWCVGCVVIAVRVCLLSPARLRLTHLEGLWAQEPQLREGRFLLTDEAFRIPKSVRVRRVRLEGAEEPLTLNLDEEWVPRAPANGARVRVQTVRKFITGIQLLEAPDAGLPADRNARAIHRGTVSRVLGSLFPLLVLWTILVPLFGGFVFTRVTDTDPAHKVTVYVDAEIINAAELAACLEEVLPPPIRMVKVHPFTYALFGSDALKRADLYIVPDSRAVEYGEWFAERPEGLLAYDPESGWSAAGSWIAYTPAGGAAEKYRLYFGRQSVHLADGAAEAVARALLALRD